MSITLAPTLSNNPQGSSALILGGSGFIGRAVCQHFGKEHWKVGIHYHTNQSHAEQIAKKMNKNDGAVFVDRADVRNFQEVNRLVQSFMTYSGELDVLVCAFGIAQTNMLVRTTPESWTEIISINLTGMFHVLKAVGPIFQTQHHGSIIVIGSLSSMLGSQGQGAYAASKAGLIGLMKTAAREWGGHNIRVNAIFPGWQASPLAGTAFPESSESDNHILGKPSTPEDVAKAVYQLSQMNDVSGQVWNLDSRIW